MIARILLAIFGSALLYVALFMYEDERAHIKDRLANWWIRLEDNREKAKSWLHEFVSATADSVNQWYTYIFGSELLSRDFFIVSALLSTGCSLIALCVAQVLVSRKVFPIFRVDPGRTTITYVLYAITGCMFLYISSIYVRRRLRRMRPNIAARRTRILVLVWSVLLLIFGFSGRYKFAFSVIGALSFYTALVVAIACDLVSIVSTRMALRVVAHSRSLTICALTLILNSALAASLILLPTWGAIDLVKRGYVAEDTPALADVPAFIAAANITTAIPGTVYFFAAATLLIHPAFAFILRPLYLLENKFPLTPGSRSVLAAAGMTSIASAIWGYPAIEVLKQLFF